MSTRLNDPTTGAIVIIMQRVNEGDLSGHILEREASDWTHVCLPMEYSGENQIVNSPLNWKDWRKEQGELLCPKRFDPLSVARLKRSLGSYGTAGQLNQRPAPRGGGIIKVSEFRLVELFNEGQIERSVRYWDKAGSEGKGCYTAGVLMHKMKAGPTDFVIEDVVRGQWSAAQREARIKQTAEIDAEMYGKLKVEIWEEQEGGSGGKESAENTIKMLAGFNIRRESVTGDKVTRARPFAAQVEIGNISLVKGPWVKEYVRELEYFPNGKDKDQTDGSSGAFNKLNDLGEESSVAGVWGRKKRI